MYQIEHNGETLPINDPTCMFGLLAAMQGGTIKLSVEEEGVGVESANYTLDADGIFRKVV